MQYAESLLLSGQIVATYEVDEESYGELRCVCPHSKTKVYYAYSYENEIVYRNELPIYTEWRHLEKLEIDTIVECQTKNEYFYSEINALNDVAKAQQINLLKPNLIELIKTSAIFEQPATFDDYSKAWNIDLFKWFAETLETAILGKEFQDRITYECQSLWKSCVKKGLEDDNGYLYGKLTENFTSYNHLTYGSQIASEMLKYALSNFDTKDRRILICLAADEVAIEAMEACASAVSAFADSLLKGNEKRDFQQLWVENKYEAMNEILKMATEIPDIHKLFVKYHTNILFPFSISLCLIFWFIPWLDELKKLNQHSQTS